eukprot:1155746-Pelagomonas_calceolata.AAC.12
MPAVSSMRTTGMKELLAQRTCSTSMHTTGLRMNFYRDEEICLPNVLAGLSMQAASPGPDHPSHPLGNCNKMFPEWQTSATWAATPSGC